jgi:hypothetical protein
MGMLEVPGVMSVRRTIAIDVVVTGTSRWFRG